MHKLIKDIVHGYISLDENFIKIIDSPEFQRLKNIRQTSYSSLYPSSLHDRFTHSIGVYQLGKYAFEHFKENVSSDYVHPGLTDDFWKGIKEVFLLACLLHDVGHAPFSHTGEFFYLSNRETPETAYIYEELIKVVNSPEFTAQFRKSIENKSVAKPHEIMSSIIGIKKWLLNRSDKDKELFARMIIGLQYSNNSDILNGIHNALICLLNSNVIDVDKLDYLLRDKTMTGFEGIGIDTERLLASVCLVNKSTTGKGSYHLGYYKNALSVVENVVIAHDSEKKWIQSHAVVLYDSFLVQRCIKAVDSYCRQKSKGSIFCEDSLGTTGITVDKQHIRLLCDADILFLAKQLTDESQYREYINEYFNRGVRKKAMWKSESEFDLMIRELGDNDRTLFVDWMEELIEEFQDGAENFDRAIVISAAEWDAKKSNYERKQGDLDVPLNEKEAAKEVFESLQRKIDLLKKLSELNGIEPNFVVVWTKPFSSNVDKFQNDEVLIKYKNFERPKPIGDVISTYSLNKRSFIQNISNIYYIYYNRPPEKNIKPADFIKQVVDLIKAFQKPNS